MSQAFWAGDSIATSIEAAGARIRANATLERQQAYHAGDIVLQRAALAALELIDSSHPILNPMVQARIEKIGQATFYKKGWSQGCSVRANAYEIMDQLRDEHEQKKRVARQQAESLEIREKRRGIPFLNRRTVYSWGANEYPTEQAATQAKASRISEIDRAQLGESF